MNFMLSAICSALLLLMPACQTISPNREALNERPPGTLPSVTPDLQAKVAAADKLLRDQHGMETGTTAVGVLDLETGRLAMVNPDGLFYGASVPKILILLTYFECHPEAATNLPPDVRRELELMIKHSSNELAAKYSQLLGLDRIGSVIEKYGFYDASQGGGLWLGKHYGVPGERVGDPVGDHSHAATARQLLRFYLMLAQGQLVSPEACQTMREIFAAPGLRHENNKFVKGLEGRELTILRKSGTWEEWLHDTAIVTGPGRHYILVGLTEHPSGDDYLAELAAAVDDLLSVP